MVTCYLPGYKFKYNLGSNHLLQVSFPIYIYFFSVSLSAAERYIPFRFEQRQATASRHDEPRLETFQAGELSTCLPILLQMIRDIICTVEHPMPGAMAACFVQRLVMDMSEPLCWIHTGP